MPSTSEAKRVAVGNAVNYLLGNILSIHDTCIMFRVSVSLCGALHESALRSGGFSAVGVDSSTYLELEAN